MRRAQKNPHLADAARLTPQALAEIDRTYTPQRLAKIREAAKALEESAQAIGETASRVTGAYAHVDEDEAEARGAITRTKRRIMLQQADAVAARLRELRELL